MDLARELEVSTATVSRALNGSERVRPELARRIRDHARDRGYVANRHARALSSNSSHAFVGFVIPYVDTPAYSAVAAECARLLSADGTQMILTITENDPRRELDQVRDLLATRVAGVVVSPSTGILAATRELLRALPVVQFHRGAGIGAPGVFSDDAALGEAVSRLVDLGHRRIGYIGPSRAISNGAARLTAVRDGAAAAGLDPDSLAVRLLEPATDQGAGAVRELLHRADRPTALVVGGGTLSLAVAREVRASGLALPGDLSLVVYGDPAWFALHDPPLTVVSVDYPELARRAARLLLGGIGGDPPGGDVLLPSELRTGGSTGPPPPGT
ncbi:LacI family DNA-binding transcriptional regulator [Pseudonocardia nantongensis]|uniref:LacI family DNA-binding transcriptional regulator n=1 Tax=Pseudonocardia nantongensis TaxID=1181885 RepID=UPI00397CCA7F